MKNLIFISTLLFVFSKLDAVYPTHELLAYKERQDRKLGEKIDDFDLSKYQIYKINGLGSFFLDNIRDVIKDFLREGIHWEKFIANVINIHTQPDTVAVDIGAHIGVHSLAMAKRVGQSGYVVAFEPQTKLFMEHVHNMRLNGVLDRVYTLNKACGNRRMNVEMNPPKKGNEGATQIGKGGNTADMITLDSLHLQNVSLIKIDVEGYEYEVLQGARETIKRNRPVIIFEILGWCDLDHLETDEHKAHYAKTLNFFVPLNYKVERISACDFIALP